MPAREFCGVIGVSLPGKGAAPYIYRGLRALQHRGQESAGIATSSHGIVHHRKGLGLVHEIFSREVVEALRGSVGIGHVRYPTTGSSTDLENAQPLVVKLRDEDGALAHNGELVNFERIRRRLQAQGVELLGNADSETIAQMIALEYGRIRDLEGAIRRACAELVGGYAVVMLVGQKLVAFRDPLGIRPLVLGTLEGGYAVASESVALDLMGGQLVREVKPGEVVVIEKGSKLHSSQMPRGNETAHCMFEWVYFSRPDSILESRSVYEVRHRIGRRLAQEAPAEADLVIPVPDSSRPQALGFSEVSKIPYAEGLIKNRFVERTFILPDQHRREEEVRVKLHPVPGMLKGRRVVLIDDSIVRGTTLREIISMVRSAGATRIDVRIGCPPIVAPCYFGIDMKDRRELVASGRTEAEVAEKVGAESVRYISIAGLVESIQIPESGLCLGCLNARYPVEVPEEHRRFQKSLEEFEGVPVTVLLRGGGTLFWIEDGHRIVAREPIAPELESLGAILAREYVDLPAARRLEWAARRAGALAEPPVARAIRAAGGRIAEADPAMLRRSRERVPSNPVEETRRWILPIARAAAREKLRGPDETLVALAREEARLERALGRERGAQSQWVSAPEGPLASHAGEAARFGEAYIRHHGILERRLEELARLHLPNLSTLVGPKVAARLLAAAGNRRALARVSGARLQLLGARRRPDPERGPRFGVLYRAFGMDTLPDDRRGAYARSLAALAVIAVRADEYTGHDVAPLLAGRRDRRHAQLLARRT